MTRALALTALLIACGGNETPDGDDASNAEAVVEPTPLRDNGWPSANEGDIPQALLDGENTGFRRGKTAPNFVLQDQNGNDVELYQFYGQFVLLDVFAQWCGPCNTHAPDGEDFYQDLKSEGFIVIGAMMESDTGTPTVSDAMDWATEHGLTHPVVADNEGVNGNYVTAGYPTYPLLAPDMTVLIEDVWPPDQNVIEQAMADWNAANP
ncbi:MAG: peroxiredoxin family protein [Myxococcota bacterium]